MHTYSVPVVKHDMRHEETILDAINAFEYLNQVINDVFGKINGRIERNRIRLEGIDARIEKASADVRRLHDSKEAIIIYSPARYPASDMDPVVEPTFTPSNGIPMEECGFRLKDKPYLPTHSLEEKIQFYHLTSARESDRIFSFDRTINPRTEEHLLGGGQQRTAYLDELLLFDEASYVREYREGKDGKRATRKDSTVHGSVIREEKIISSSSPIIRSKMKRKNQDLFYTPSLSDAPKLDVPVDLPDLPGIVSNISYVGSSTLIAPSLQLAGIIEQLPSLEDLSSAIDVADHSKETKEEQLSTGPALPPTAYPSGAGERSTISTPIVAPPPPPPPPPPPTVLSDSGANAKQPSNTVSSTTASSDKRTAPAPPSLGDAHCNLMEAIRRAGGAEKAKLRHNESATARSTNASGEPKSLIDDLHNKLQMRRKGISGARDAAEPTPNVIDRLSALIPPPPAKLPTAAASGSESNEEEDWE